MLLPILTEFILLAQTLHERSGTEIRARFNAESKKQISIGSLYPTLARMRERGWVKVRNSKDRDGRIRLFHITSEGRRLYNEVRANYAKMAAFPDAAVPSSVDPRGSA